MSGQTSKDVASLLADGQLAAAIEVSTARLRASPTDHASRTTLAELLCLAGSFERAEAQLAMVAAQTVDRPVALARMRHLIRAAVARAAWFEEAAVPALLGEPTPGQRMAIDLALAMRADDPGAVPGLLEAIEAARPHLAGTSDGVAFDDFRDADDRSAWFLEVLTHDGGYLWVDTATVAGLRFTPASRPIDLLWRETRMALHDGRVADVAIPAQYVCAKADDTHRLAQTTDWEELPGGAFAGCGQRLFLVGEESKGLLDIGEILFVPPRLAP